MNAPVGVLVVSARFVAPIQSSTAMLAAAVPSTLSGAPGARQAGKDDVIVGPGWASAVPRKHSAAATAVRRTPARTATILHSGAASLG